MSVVVQVEQPGRRAIAAPRLAPADLALEIEALLAADEAGDRAVLLTRLQDWLERHQTLSALANVLAEKYPEVKKKLGLTAEAGPNTAG